MSVLQSCCREKKWMRKLMEDDILCTVDDARERTTNSSSMEGCHPPSDCLRFIEPGQMPRKMPRKHDMALALNIWPPVLESGQVNITAGNRCPKQTGASLVIGFVVGSD